MPLAAPTGAHAPARAVTHLLYLHGFRSSPRSFKAERMRDWMAARRPEVHWCCPQLPPSPRAAIELALQRAAGWPPETTAVVGSSLGGFYATVLAERLGCRAMLLNPAVDPARDLAPFVGELTAFHDPTRRFEFRPEHLDELRALTPGAITRPERYAAVIARGDELLDWREMAARYAGAQLRVLDGGDHALSDFDTHLPFVRDFLGLARPGRCAST